MRRTWVGIVVLAGCGGRAATTAPIEHRGTAPGLGEGLVTEMVGVEEMMECVRHDLALRVVADGMVADEVVLEGTCRGACTAEDKAAGEAQLAEIEAAIARGESSEGELDYDFTGCTFYGVSGGRSLELAGQRIELLVGHHPGPHDIPNRYFQIAAELCAKVFLSDEFGATYADRWQLEALEVDADDDELTVHVTDDDGELRELYRVQFDVVACTAAQQVSEAEF